MMNREILMDKNDIPPDGIPTGLEGWSYQYQIDTWNQGCTTFDLTYLEQCINFGGKELISLVDKSNDGSVKVLITVAKILVLEAYM
jgi:hypothetical protein